MTLPEKPSSPYTMSHMLRSTSHHLHRHRLYRHHLHHLHRQPRHKQTSKSATRVKSKEHSNRTASPSQGIIRIDQHGEHLGPIHNGYRARRTRYKATADQAAGTLRQCFTAKRGSSSSGAYHILSTLLRPLHGLQLLQVEVRSHQSGWLPQYLLPFQEDT